MLLKSRREWTSSALCCKLLWAINHVVGTLVKGRVHAHSHIQHQPSIQQCSPYLQSRLSSPWFGIYLEHRVFQAWDPIQFVSEVPGAWRGHRDRPQVSYLLQRQRSSRSEHVDLGEGFGVLVVSALWPVPSFYGIWVVDSGVLFFLVTWVHNDVNWFSRRVYSRWEFGIYCQIFLRVENRLGAQFRASAQFWTPVAKLGFIRGKERLTSFLRWNKRKASLRWLKARSVNRVFINFCINFFHGY